MQMAIGLGRDGERQANTQNCSNYKINNSKKIIL
jgi:hypothetical protein